MSTRPEDCDGCAAGADWQALGANPSLCEPCAAHWVTL